MTSDRRRLLFFFAAVVGLSGSLWYLSKTDQNNVLATLRTKERHPAKKVIIPPLRTPASVALLPRNHRGLQEPALDSPVWKEKMENTLRVQGGGQIKAIEIVKLQSFNWTSGGSQIPVESVLVKIQHVKGHHSSFRAMVDSTNGKILQTWDPPVIDDFGHTLNVGVRIDPRYHQD